MQRIDTILAEAVRERGYADYRPLVEAEYMRPAGAPALLWRVTLRCVVGGYQQKAAPQPVVVTAPDLNAAFRLLEGQFAASSGKPQPTPASSTHSGHRRHSTAPPRPARGRPRQQSAPNRPTPPHSASAPADPQHSSAQPSAPNDPPPSYHDAMRGGHPPSSFSAKRTL